MAHNVKYLPYFKIIPNREEKIAADFLLRKFRPAIKRKIPQHYLIQSIPYETLDFVQKISKKYPYFLRFDIKLYYPSISPQILLEKLPDIYQEILEKSPSRKFNNYLKNEIPEFLAKSPYGKGIPVGSRLSFALAGLFLLTLDWKIPCPFLRHNDDYLIFCKENGNAQKLLKNIILPELKKLGLEINEKKLRSGKFWREKVNFVGFEFYSGYIRISEEKIEEFKQKIIKLTYLTRNKPLKAVVKQLNNQILGFGHYYKIAQAKIIFTKLDAFTRARLRRYLQRNKDSRDKRANLMLTNAVLKSNGLKSLEDICLSYGSKKRPKFKKKTDFGNKTGKLSGSYPDLRLKEIQSEYVQKQILQQLSQQTGLMKKLERGLNKIERKL